MRGRFTGEARPTPAVQAKPLAEQAAPTMGQGRSVTDQGVARAPEATEAERQRALREAFRPPSDRETSAQRAHKARLREQFGEKPAAGAEQDPAARQRALREAFGDKASDKKRLPGKTPEELRQAFKDREKPAPKQDRGRDSGRTKSERGREGGQGRER